MVKTLVLMTVATIAIASCQQQQQQQQIDEKGRTPLILPVVK